MNKTDIDRSRRFGVSLLVACLRNTMMMTFASRRLLGISLIIAASATAAQAAPVASETFLLWPGTPPGTQQGDDALASATAKATREKTYKIPGGNRRGIRIPACDVYLPPKAKRTGTAMVVYCGGGYGAVCIGSEGMPMAKFLNDHGIAVFMVSYRCRPYKHPIPFWDVQRAIRVVRHHAKRFDVKPDRIGIMGFSAGGHVTSTLSVHYNETFGRDPIDEIDKVSARADFSCLIYPVISMRKGITHGGSRRNLLGGNPPQKLVVKLSNDEQVDENTPPAFLVHGRPDRVVKYINSQRYHEACRKHGVPTRIVLMEKGGHGPALRNGKPSIKGASEDYADAMVAWIRDLGDAPPAAKPKVLTLTNGNFDAEGPVSHTSSVTGWKRTIGNGIFHGTSMDLDPDGNPNQALLNTRDKKGIGTEFTSDVLTGPFVPGTTYALDYKFAVRNGKIPLPAAHDLRVEIVGSTDGVLATSGDLAPRITKSDTYYSGTLIWDSTRTVAQDLRVILRAAGAQNQTFGFDSLDLGIASDTDPPGLTVSPGGTTYHVDSNRGSDNHKGTSAESAWKSLAKLNRIAFKPGDRILLKAGCTFAGPLRPNGSGAKGKPIVIDRYGEGADPIVAGAGKVENAIRLHNQHHWEIRHLTVTNTDGGGWGDAGRSIRRAVYITAENAGDVEHIHLQNLDIRDVRGMYRFAGHQTNGGIICQVTGTSKKTRFADLRIEGCTFRTTSIDRYPVAVTSSWRKAPACQVVWKDNRLDHAGRAHIVIPPSEWPRKLVYYFDPEVGKVFPLEKTAPPVSPLTGRVGCEDIFSEIAARLKRSWGFYEATRVKEGQWLFANQPGGKVHHVDEGARVSPTYPLAYYGELRAFGFVPPWLDADDPDLRKKEDAILEQWIGQLDTVGVNREADWSVRNRVFMNKTPYPAPRTGKAYLRSLSYGVRPDLTTPASTLKYFNSLPWKGNPYMACGRIGHTLHLHIAKRNQAGKEPIDAAYHQVKELVAKKYNPGKGYWGGKASPDANMKILCLYAQFGWPIPEPKKIIDFHLSRATESAGFRGGGCKAFNQMHPLANIFRQNPELAGYRGEEIDRYTAMTFITFLGNWNNKTNFYGNNWLGKHNNGAPLFMAHLMLDLPIMRVSTVYNWREGPIITRSKDGTIRRNKVIHQTKGFPFGG